jgi:hypothetical protein
MASDRATFGASRAPSSPPGASPSGAHAPHDSLPVGPPQVVRSTRTCMRASRKIVRRPARTPPRPAARRPVGMRCGTVGEVGGTSVGASGARGHSARLGASERSARSGGAAGRPDSARRFVDHRRPTRARIRAINPGPLESLRPDGNRASTGNAATPISPAPRAPLDGPLAHTARAQGGEAPGGRPGDPARGAGTGPPASTRVPRPVRRYRPN